MINEYKEILVKLNATIGSYSSQIVDMTLADKASVQLIWEEISSFSGEADILASNDGKVFSKIEGSVVSISGTDSYMLNMPDVCFRFVMVQLSVTSGSCNFMANCVLKGGVS